MPTLYDENGQKSRKTLAYYQGGTNPEDMPELHKNESTIMRSPKRINSMTNPLSCISGSRSSLTNGRGKLHASPSTLAGKSPVKYDKN